MKGNVSTAAIFLCCFSGVANAETIINCGGSTGYSYYFRGGILPPENPGWTTDGINDGAIALTYDGEKADILIKDFFGMTSAAESGARVNIVDVSEQFITVLVNYIGGSKEMYTFDLERKVVAWSQHKFGVLIDKAHTMVGSCGGEID